MQNSMKKFVCCICGNEFEGFGNNPAPICEEAGMRCCDKCNEDVVIPERIMRIFMAKAMRNNKTVVSN